MTRTSRDSQGLIVISWTLQLVVIIFFFCRHRPTLALNCVRKVVVASHGDHPETQWWTHQASEALLSGGTPEVAERSQFWLLPRRRLWFGRHSMRPFDWDSGLTPSRFWQSVRRLTCGKQRFANTVYRRGGMLLGDEYFLDLLDPTSKSS